MVEVEFRSIHEGDKAQALAYMAIPIQFLHELELGCGSGLQERGELVRVIGQVSVVIGGGAVSFGEGGGGHDFIEAVFPFPIHFVIRVVPMAVVDGLVGIAVGFEDERCGAGAGFGEFPIEAEIIPGCRGVYVSHIGLESQVVGGVGSSGGSVEEIHIHGGGVGHGLVQVHIGRHHVFQISVRQEISLVLEEEDGFQGAVVGALGE